MLYALTDDRFAKARAMYENACCASRQWDSTLAAAIAEHGNGNGVAISGCGRDHFPAHVKDELRALARSVGDFSDAAMNARPRKVQRATMRALYAAIAERDGCGFYGPMARRK